ncbi:MAG: peptide methionine sulfoxide reductase [Bacteroidia bacterium]|nr:peptide methionine sulfoxide reductase [Bacteroidia bacterium]
MKKDLRDIIHQIPKGYSEVLFEGRKYSLTKKDFNKGQSTKVFAEDLGGNDFISFNFYLTQSGPQLKPCEMPEKKVLDFLMGFEKIEQ